MRARRPLGSRSTTSLLQVKVWPPTLKLTNAVGEGGMLQAGNDMLECSRQAELLTTQQLT